jgi:hypothetical protein
MTNLQMVELQVLITLRFTSVLCNLFSRKPSNLSWVSKLQTSKKQADLLANQGAEVLAATIRNDNESTEKVLLLRAQTLGFKTDTKQKVLKQMVDGFSVHYSVAGTGNIPETLRDASIDQLSQDILNNVDGGVATVRIQTPDETPHDVSGGDV